MTTLYLAFFVTSSYAQTNITLEDSHSFMSLISDSKFLSIGYKKEFPIDETLRNEMTQEIENKIPLHFNSGNFDLEKSRFFKYGEYRYISSDREIVIGFDLTTRLVTHCHYLDTGKPIEVTIGMSLDSSSGLSYSIVIDNKSNFKSISPYARATRAVIHFPNEEKINLSADASQKFIENWVLNNLAQPWASEELSHIALDSAKEIFKNYHEKPTTKNTSPKPEENTSLPQHKKEPPLPNNLDLCNLEFQQELLKLSSKK